MVFSNSTIISMIVTAQDILKCVVITTHILCLIILHH